MRDSTYTPDHALNDLYLFEPVGDDVPQGYIDAFQRLEEWLLRMPVPKMAIREEQVACNDCIFLYGRNGTCSHEEVVHKDYPKTNPAACELQVRHGEVGQ